MTISSTYAPDTYSGDGATTTFAITFAFLSVSTNVKVSIKVDSTGVVTEKTAGTHYNVSGSNVVFTAGNIPASGETVLIELNPDYKQETDYVENNVFPADTLETDLDQLKLEVQLAKDQADRSIRFDSAVDVSSFTATIPATTADKFIKINSAGTGFELGTGDSILDSLAKTDGNFIVGDGTNFVVESGATARASLGVDTAIYNSDFTATEGYMVKTAADTYTLRTITGTANQIGVTNGDGTSGNPVLTIADNAVLPGTEGMVAPAGTTAQRPGSPATGELRYNTTTNLYEYYNASSWQNFAVGGGIANVVEDTTPQLGGQLDVNGQALGDGTNELLTFTEDASAVNHVDIENEATGSGPIIQAAGDDTNIDLVLKGKGTGEIKISGASLELDSGEGVVDSGGDELLVFAEDTTPVNHLQITNADTAVAPILEAVGDDANVDLDIKAKGTGTVDISAAALEIDNGATGPGEVRLLEDSDNGTNYMGWKAPASVTSSLALELPDGDGSNGQTLTTNGSGVLSWGSAGASQAVQADIEAETNEDTYIPPDLLKYSPGVAKAWTMFDGTGTPATVVSHNVSSITDNGVGDYTVNLGITMSSANYCTVATAGQISSESALRGAAVENDTVTTTSVTLIVGHSSAAHADQDNISVAIFGDL